MASYPPLTPSPIASSGPDAVGQAEATGPKGEGFSSERDAAEMLRADDDGGSSRGSGRLRIQPIDTKLRLQLMKTQVCTYTERRAGPAKKWLEV